MFQNIEDSLAQLKGRYSVQYTNAAQTQSSLDRYGFVTLRYQKKVDKYKKENAKDQEDYEEKATQLALVNQNMPYLEDLLTTIKEPQVAKRYEVMLQEDQYTKLELQDWINKNNPIESNEEFMNYHLSLAAMEYYKAAGIQLAEWFATGAAGPGTVNFMGKEYKA